MTERKQSGFWHRLRRIAGLGTGKHRLPDAYEAQSKELKATKNKLDTALYQLALAQSSQVTTYVQPEPVTADTSATTTDDTPAETNPEMTLTTIDLASLSRELKANRLLQGLTVIGRIPAQRTSPENGLTP